VGGSKASLHSRRVERYGDGQPWRGVGEVRPPERDGAALLYDTFAHEVYARDDTDRRVVLDGQTGRLRRRLGKETSAGAARIVKNGILYIEQSHPGYLLAVDGREDRVLWTKNYPPPDRMFKPVMYDEILYTRTSQDAILAISRHTGDILWQFPYEADSSASLHLLSNLVILDRIVYGIFSDARLRGFDAVTGREIGHVQFADVANVLYTDLTVPGLASSDNMLFVSLAVCRRDTFPPSAI
jgi:outer membrane protein assembly factor BamB